MNQYPGHNPYAPPQSPVANAGYGPGGYGGPTARVEGKLLVAMNGSALPAMCLKCGAPPTHWRAQNYRYTPPWAMMIGWIGILIFSRKSSFQIPLCEQHRAEWKKWNLIAGLSFLPGVVLCVLGGILAGTASDDAGAGIVLFGVLVLFVALITALILRGKKIVFPMKIDKTQSWLRGVHPAVLNAVTPADGPQRFADT